MIKEEIEQKANKALDKRMGTICYIKRDNVQIPYTDGFCDGYLTCAKENKKKLKAQIEKTLNEIDKYMCLSNMREREIYDIQEIFRQNGFKRDSVDKWEIAE